jgi:ABC-2 type transport system permease protein
MMKKLWTIGLKDLRVAFRDRAALIMLVAPFVLTLAMGFITGGFSEDGNGLERIPIAIVNQDEGDLGSALASWLQDESMEDLLEVTLLRDPVLARQKVEESQYSGALIIPPEFTEDVILNPDTSAGDGGGSVEFFTNPGEPIRANIVKSMIDRFIGQVEIGVVSSQIAVSGLVQSRLIQPQEAPAIGRDIGERLVTQAGGLSLITVSLGEIQADESDFNPLAILAPSMAMLFLMYTVTSVGGRSILAEREEGTLSRMLSTPTGAAQVLGGKVFGIVLVGIVQVTILVAASSLLFQLSWGDPLAVIILIVVAVIGATGWGILLAAFASTPGQVASVGAALMLTFGLLGGSFFGGAGFEGLLGVLSKVTPNAWAQEGFLRLAQGGTMVDIYEPIAGLLLMGGILFAIAVVVFRRRGLNRS